MKKLLSSFVILLAAFAVVAQNSFSYQSVIRADGKVLENKSISLRLSIMLDDSICYQEQHAVTTNAYGNVNVSVGEGELLKGSFDAVPWESMRVMMRIEADVTGGADFTDLGSMQIMPVPYAMYAHRTTTVIQPAEASDEPIFEINDSNGNPMFAVYETGVKVFVDYDDESKAAKSKFAVAGVKKGKADNENLLTIDGSGTIVYVDDNNNPNGKAAKSKFAVSGLKKGKERVDLLTIDGSGSTIYVDDSDNQNGKAAKSKFAVSGLKKGKERVDLFTIDGTGSTVYVDDNDIQNGKAAKSKFAVSGLKKGKERVDLLTIDGTGSTIYIDDDENQNGKAAKSKFAVAGRPSSKDGSSQAENMFTIDDDGSTIYVDFNYTDKAAKSKFAVAGRRAKGVEDVVTIDGDKATFYVDIDENENSGKAAKSKFAVAGRPSSKDESVPYFIIDQFGSLIYIDDDENQNGKAAKSKFAVAGVKKGKGDTFSYSNSFMTVEDDSTRIYINDEVVQETGSFASNFAIVSMLENTDLMIVKRDSAIIKMNLYESDELQTATGTVERLYVTVKFADGANGKVLGYLDGKQLGDTCDVTRGTVIKLETQPDDGYSFLAWSDGSIEPERYVTINTDTVFSAEFIPGFKFSGTDSAWITTTQIEDFDIDYKNFLSFSDVAVDTIELDERRSVHYLLYDSNGNTTDNEADAVAIALRANDTTFIARALKPFKGTVAFGLRKTDSDTVKIVVDLDSETGLWYNLPAGDFTYGTVTSEGDMNVSDIVTLTAAAKDGKVFGGWKTAGPLQLAPMVSYNKQCQFPLIYDIIGTTIEPVFAEPMLYVADAADSSNTGFSASEPLPSIDLAVSKIIQLQPDKLNWTINVVDLVKGKQTIPGEFVVAGTTDTLKAVDYIDSILLTGTNEDAVLNGGFWIDDDGVHNDYGYTEQFSVLTIDAKVPVTVENLKITGGNGTPLQSLYGVPVGCGVFISDYANVTLGEGVFVSNNKNENSVGGGVYAGDYSTLNISGAIIENNSNEGSQSLMGGGVAVGYNSTLNMTDGVISGHKASSGGGGVYVGNSSVFNMTGGTITGNTADYGGGVFVTSEDTLYMSGTAVIGDYDPMYMYNSYSNEATTRGGGIYAKEALVYIGYKAPKNQGDDPVEDDEFEGGIFCNYSGYEGGGVSVDAGSVLKMHGGTISYNSAYSKGGGVFVNYDYEYPGNIAEFTMDGGIVSNNTTASEGGDGGAVYVCENAKFNIGGSASIPAGLAVSDGFSFTLETGPRMNDVYLNDTVNIISNLTAAKPVATLTFGDCYSEMEAVKGLLVGEHGEKNYEKIAVTPYYTYNYLVNEEGKLAECYFVDFIYYDRVPSGKQTQIVRMLARRDTIIGEKTIKAPIAPVKSGINSYSTTVGSLGWFVIKDDGTLEEFDDTQPISNSTTIVYVWKEEATLNGSGATFANAVQYFLDPYCAYTINVKNGNAAQVISDNLFSEGVHAGGLKFHSITLQSYNDEYTTGKQKMDLGWVRNDDGTWTNQKNNPLRCPVFTINTRVPITIKNLKITGGYNPDGDGHGGGIYIGGNSNVTIGEDAEITGNCAKYGAGVYIDNGGKLNMASGNIDGNYANNCGAGVYINENAQLNMAGGNIADNNANSWGAGVYVGGQLNMTNGTIADNNAGSLGGGVYVNSATFKMEGGTIQGNVAGEYGNGVYTGCNIELAGSAKIASDNDVYLSSFTNSYITITKALTIADDDTLAVLSFLTYSYQYPVNVTQVVRAANGVQLADYTDKFAVMPGIGATWHINNVGRLETTSLEGALYKPFTVNAAGKKVYFSRSSIKYKSYYARYQFEETQYDSFDSGYYYSWGDGNSLPTSNTIYNFNGNLTSDQWRTLTKEEWEYLINRPGKCALASIKPGSITHNGLVLLPDDWSGAPISGDTYDSKEYTESEWQAMENNGAVFLEAAGYMGHKSASGLFEENEVGQYWSSTNAGDDAYLLSFKSDKSPVVTTCADSYTSGLTSYETTRNHERPVRLVLEIDDPNAFYVNPDEGNDDNDGHSSGSAFNTFERALSAIQTAAQTAENKDFVIYVDGVSNTEYLTISGCGEKTVSKITIYGETEYSCIIYDTGSAITINDDIEVTLSNLGLSGVVVQKGTLNISGCVIDGGEWTGVEMSDGSTVNIENSDFYYNNDGVLINGGTLNLKSGANIHNNRNNDINNIDGTVTVSGTAKAGVVRLASGKKITIAGELAEGKDTVATIVPANYPVEGGAQVFVLEKAGGLSADETERFAVKKSSDGQEWEIATTGALTKAIGGKASMKALPGRFKIGEDSYINFSSGNLRYNAKKNEWGFAEHQYDFLAADNNSIAEDYNGWIDLFGWGTSGYEAMNSKMNPWLNEADVNLYYDGNLAGTNYDWGKTITTRYATTEQWRTLKNTEWGNLITYNTHGYAKVNGYKGLVIIPEGFQVPNGLTFESGITASNYNTNNYTADQWILMEKAGAVFLPEAGYRSGNSTRNFSYQYAMSGTTYGYYWTSTYYTFNYSSKQQGYYFVFGNGSSVTYQSYTNYYTGCSVRLVCDAVEGAGGTTLYVAPNASDANDNYDGIDESQPLKTFYGALLKMTDSEMDYTVILDGAGSTICRNAFDEFGGLFNLEGNSVMAAYGYEKDNLEINSEFSASSIIIDGRSSTISGQYDYDESGTVFVISTETPVTFKNLTITDGYSDGSYPGGCIRVGSVSTVILDEGAYLEGGRNTSTGKGGGVYVANGGTLIMKASAVVKVNEAGSEIYSDVYLENGAAITIGSHLTGKTSDEIPYVARITPAVYDEGVQVLKLATDVEGNNISGTELANEVAKFTVADQPNYANPGNPTKWYVGPDGCLTKTKPNNGGTMPEGFTEVAGGTISKESYNVGWNDNDFDGDNMTIPSLLVCNHLVSQYEYEQLMTYYGAVNTAHPELQPSETTAEAKKNTPAYYVSWFDAIIYCNLLSMAEDKEPVYSIDGVTDPTSETWSYRRVAQYGGKYYYNDISQGNGLDSDGGNFDFDFSHSGYRLLTSAEFNYLLLHNPELITNGDYDEWCNNYNAYSEGKRIWFNGTDNKVAGADDAKINYYRAENFGFRIVRIAPANP
ncbi:MAG: SUMF1/EgtB/PvdO family nonheme iron enzyme [Salinivirgaceae bacterium]|nr:SUMF1/EgtB/PvdO family nonheme iron enzyme [Salinivirgaceae bacterium]